MTRRFMSALCAATALTAFPVHAQSTGEPTPSATANEPRTAIEPSAPGEPTASQQAQTGDAASAATGDVVVTAQRRAERLIDVPISVTAVTPQDMASGGVTSSTDLDRVTPGLVMATTASHAQPNIRGVGSALTGPGADNNVAVYVDGVYQANQSSLIFEFNNVQQIEVLKGPQGTLFGRNATGGAITVKTLDPGFTPEVRLSAGYGNLDDYRASGYVNVPLTDKVAINLSGIFRDQGGYVRNLFNNRLIPGIKAHAFIGKILIQPTDNFRVILAGTYSERDDQKNEAFAPYPELPPPPAYASPTVRRPGPAQTNQDNDPIYNLHVRAGSLRTELDLEAGTISTISAYNHYHGNLGFDLDQSPAATGFSFIFDRSNMFSQEVNFASEKWGAFSFVAGLYYYNDISRRFQRLTNGAGATTLATRSNVRTEAYAAYAEGTFDITEALHLTAGVRYSIEEKEGNGTRTVGVGRVHLEDKWNSFTPRLALRYEISPSSNIYASYSKGFKSGVFNVAGLQAQSVEPENIDAYEIGFKSSSNGIRFSASAFYYKYSNIQVQAQLEAALLIYQNAASATIYGGDFDVSLPLTDWFTLSGGAAYTHGRYDDFPGALTGRLQPNGTVAIVNCAVDPVGCDASGNITTRTPEFQGNITGTVNYPIESGRFGATATFSYLGKYPVAGDNRVFTPAQTQTSGEISFTTADDKWRFAIWGKNLTNEVRLLYLTGGGSSFSIYDVPRTYGFTVGFNFK